MAEGQLTDLANALIGEAANRLLLIPGTRGVFITLVHEEAELPLGTCTLAESATVRDIVMALRRANDASEVLTKMLLQHIDGSASEREDRTDLGETSDDGTIPDERGAQTGSQAVGTANTAERAEGQPG